MAFRDLKAATKDIDVVVADGEAFRTLQSALTDLDYAEVKDPNTVYDNLGASAILENEDGCRFDIFNQQVVDKLVFSEGMKERSEEFLSDDRLVVRMASREDVFLFKSVAGRPDDIEDMNVLVQSGLDFDAVESELRRQIELLDEEFFVTEVGEALLDLEDRFGVTTPLDDLVTEISKRVYEELEVLLATEDSESTDEVKDAVELPREEAEAVLGRLEEKGLAEVENGRVERLEGRP
jgi:predicted nucleotidyltransferase